MTPAELAALLETALPAEPLSADELEATLFDDPDGALVGDAGAAVGVATRGRTGYVTVIAVHPARQRQGRGAALLEEAHRWLRAQGAVEVVTGASAPRYLWPGVDVDRHVAALRLFEAAGYVARGSTRNHRCPTGYRAEPAAGTEVRRLRAGSADAAAAVALAAASFPDWVDELERALPNGCAHGAFAPDGRAAGFACHSVNRAGWIGPMATDPAWQGRGVGSALLGAVCRDLQLAELDEAEIAWVGPDAFYRKTAGTSVSRRFALLARPL